MNKKKLTIGQKQAMAAYRFNNLATITEKLTKEVKTIWQKRGQTFEEYQKRNTDFTTIFPVNPEKHIKKDEQPESIQTLKYKLRRIKGTSKFKHEGKLIKITSSLVRRLKSVIFIFSLNLIT